ncbi:MAG: Hpt domain-containing protein [Ruminiclostridium sp.]
MSQSLINKETGIRYCANDEEFLTEMLETLVDSYEETLAKITNAFGSADWKNYTIYVHGLKSSSLTVGGEVLSAAAKELEMAGKAIGREENTAENEAFIRSRHDSVMELYKDTVQEAKELIEKSR